MPVDTIDLNYIIECAQHGNEMPFNIFFENVFQKIKPKLLSYTKSVEDSHEVYVISMQKFWERFVINQEDLPHNSIGYILMMCKNAWLMQRRGKASRFVSVENPAEYHDQIPEDPELENMENNLKDQDITLLKHKALVSAINLLSEKCKTLIENEMDTDMQLKDLQEEFGYTNYQALVQAKYNCKKRLIRKVYEALEKLKENQKY